MNITNRKTNGKECGLSDKLNLKSVVITGATSGIGLATARQLVREGALVIGVGRSDERIHIAKTAILADFPKGQIVYILADLSEQSTVRELAREISRTLADRGYSHLDALVNNAGVYLAGKQITGDGLEMTFAVNHLAPFLLTHDLIPLLLHAEHGKVLTVSSYSHRTTPLNLRRIADPRPYIGLLAYKRSKLCNVLFTYEFNRRNIGVTALAVDPGLVNTGIASKGGKGLSHWIWRKRREKGTAPSVPAETIIHLVGEDHIDTSKGFYFFDKVAKSPSPKARNKNLARKLWSLSCQLTGVEW